MFDNRDNLIGVLFLVMVGVLAAILINAIITGERVTWDLPPAVSAVLGIAFFGLIIYGVARSGMFSRWFGGGEGGSGRQWPDPQTGRKSLWDRIRGK